jgi:hypothetical protein
MTEDQRAAIVAKIGAVPTCDGRALSEFNSALLIAQCPHVSMVGGFRQWLRNGRQVRKGEKGLGIWILTGRD